MGLAAEGLTGLPDSRDPECANCVCKLTLFCRLPGSKTPSLCSSWRPLPSVNSSWKIFSTTARVPFPCQGVQVPLAALCAVNRSRLEVSARLTLPLRICSETLQPLHLSSYRKVVSDSSYPVHKEQTEWECPETVSSSLPSLLCERWNSKEGDVMGNHCLCILTA